MRAIAKNAYLRRCRLSFGHQAYAIFASILATAPSLAAPAACDAVSGELYLRRRASLSQSAAGENLLAIAARTSKPRRGSSPISRQP